LTEELARDDPESYNENAKFRALKYKNILQQQFQLVYFGKLTWQDTENMSLIERQHVYDILYNQKKEEKENYEKQIQEAKQKQKANSSRPVRHSGRR